MRKVLVSACLLGERVRYDGAARPLASDVLSRWLAEGRVVPFCPEVAGGLPVPRPPAEVMPDGRVVDVHGADRSDAFARGARLAVDAARSAGVVLAVLKDASPSCGSSVVHDGSFSERTVPGAGLTTRALRAAGIPVFSERELEAADDALDG